MLASMAPGEDLQHLTIVDPGREAPRRATLRKTRGNPMVIKKGAIATVVPIRAAGTTMMLVPATLMLTSSNVAWSPLVSRAEKSRGGV